MGAQRTKRLHNRIAAVMAHTTRYAFKGQARLAQDAGLSKAAVHRLIAGKTSPTYHVVAAVGAALERQIGRPIHLRELLSPEGTYPTPCICDLVGCRGCLPDAAYLADGTMTAEFRDTAPGCWSGDAPPSVSEAPARIFQRSVDTNLRHGVLEEVR